MSIGTSLPEDALKGRFLYITSVHKSGNTNKQAKVHLPESQPLVQLLEKVSVKLVYRVDVRKKEAHQAFGHGVFFDYSTAEPLEVEDKA